MKIDLAVFDMAGTTIDEGQHVYRILSETSVAHGGPADVDQWHGAAKHEALGALLNLAPGDEKLELVVADFRARLAAAYAEFPPKPLPGVPDALAALRAAGVRVALSTGFDREIVGSLLPALGWDDSVVDVVVCGSDVPAGRPAPYMIFRAMETLGVTDVSRVLVAGDTPRDLRSGRNAGAGFVVGVLSGAGTVAELGAERHTHLLPSVAEVPGLVA
ncbi:phosphonatase-like hydrolase [Cryptosporangium phraense]|uniref:Phosphonatase-like hydrolase n=1 Tax=Cryptosporangium phraense TaxID=2593070 RepID=A0A545AMU4_9ACTN|nr:phosphonatase-like hydrolase [Cryptosporangium phraense]TQS42065.1 phosphonatase-like hydrolase [Cryptosporangium phraense]